MIDGGAADCREAAGWSRGHRVRARRERARGEVGELRGEGRGAGFNNLARVQVPPPRRAARRTHAHGA